MTSARSWVDK